MVRREEVNRRPMKLKCQSGFSKSVVMTLTRIPIMVVNKAAKSLTHSTPPFLLPSSFPPQRCRLSRMFSKLKKKRLASTRTRSDCRLNIFRV